MSKSTITLIVVAVFAVVFMLVGVGSVANQSAPEPGEYEITTEPRITQERASRHYKRHGPLTNYPKDYDYEAEQIAVLEDHRERAEAAEAARVEAEQRAARDLARQQAAEVARLDEERRQREATRSAPVGGVPGPEPDRSGSAGAFDRLAQCESGKRNITNPSGKYRGYFQFDLPTWRSTGFSGDPLSHSWEQQLRAAQILQSRRGWHPWPQCARKLGLL